METKKREKLSEFDWEELGVFIWTKRDKAGLTQKDLVEKLDTVDHFQYMSKIERGKARPSLPVVVELFDFFGVSLDTLKKPDFWETEGENE